MEDHTHYALNPLRIKRFDKWKFQFSISLFFFFFLQLLASASSRSWDGVMVTRADYQTLRAIRHNLVDSNGVLRSWNGSGFGVCSGKWEGIKCVRGQVIAIQLPWKGLGGKISDKIGQLQSLRKLSLHDNVLVGTIPSSIRFLPNLRGLYLFNNKLSGSIPPLIGNCVLLQNLDLSNNLLTGSIPHSLVNATTLYRVNLSFNSFSGSIPESLTRFSALSVLALQYNNLSGPVPDTWGLAGNDSYQILTLDHNFLSGSVPVTLSKLRLLEQLDLSHNQISGVIPNELGSLSKLRRLDFSNNAINGSLPASFSNLTALDSLDLESNLLADRIQETIFPNLKNLSVLNLKSNQFNGEIPATIGDISGISRIDLSENGFSGEIPEEFGKLEKLESFNVSYNDLSGSVPSVLSRKFNSSSFVGNLQLCGFSSSTPCPSPPPENPPASSPEPMKSTHTGRRLSTKDIILIAAGALLAVLLLLCCIVLCCVVAKRAAKDKSGKTRKRSVAGSIEKAVASGPEAESGGEAGGKLVHFEGPFVFTADDLLCATAEIMGKSTYGTAYKATLEDGNQVAVKRLREKTTKGQKEFETEAAALGKIRHQNLCALRAYYLGPKGEKLLVFDYMPKGSLASFLHARGPETTINWPTRMNLITGIARGLNYLHSDENMVHGNLTSSNILLDEQTNAHIADHGLSRLMTAAANTNVIATAGTLGYRAPELPKTKKPTTKTDVYSLGVIILELLTGKSPGEGPNGEDLPQWVASIVKEEWTNEVFDLELMRDDTATTGDELLNTLKLALHCVDPAPEARPEVQQVIQQLEEIRPEHGAGDGDDGALVPFTE